MRLAALAIFLVSMLPFCASASAEHYYVSSSNEDDSFSGYAAVETGKDGKITGRICAFDDSSEIGSPLSLELLGTVLIEGSGTRKSLQLEFRPEEAAQSQLKDMLPTHSVKFEPRAAYEVNLEELLMWGGGWESTSSGEKATRLWFAKIPKEIKPKKRDQFADLSNGKKFDLRGFDKMSPKQALSFIVKTEWNEVIAPSFVQVVYRPSDRRKIIEFLSQYNGIKFHDTPRPDCGAPYVEEGITVPALLEFYFARKLQASGLVARAYPYSLPRSPPVLMLSLKSLELKNKFKLGDLSVEERSRSIGDFLETQLRSFLRERRPQFTGPWEVTQRNSGSEFVYRWEVVGASISACNPARWEKFDLQIAFTLGDMLTLQVLEGSQAPSSLKERPSDERFKDNRLGDDALEKIQDGFHGFLVKRGLTLKEYEPSFTAACNL